MTFLDFLNLVGGLALFTLFGVVWLAAPTWIAAHALWLSFAGQGLVALGALAARLVLDATFGHAHIIGAEDAAVSYTHLTLPTI